MLTRKQFEHEHRKYKKHIDMDAAYQLHATRAHRQTNAKPDETVRMLHHIPVVLSESEWEAVRATRPRVSNWSRAMHATSRSAHLTVRDVDGGAYSRRCTWRKIEHHPQVFSAVWITPTGRYLIHQYGPAQTVHKAPRGWLWSVDVNGVHIRNTKGDADYHISTRDLTDSRRGVRWCIELAREGAATRHQAACEARRAAKAQVQEAEMLKRFPAYACYVDSRKAGNCGEGTRKWMERHQIDAAHIPVSRLETIRDSNRVQSVIAYAIKRHLREIEEGCCRLAEHWPELANVD